MESSIAFSVRYKAVAFFVGLPAVRNIVGGILRKVILIHKIVPRVVRRVNVNHLDFAEVCFLQQLQRFKVVTFNVEVLCCIKINRFFTTWAQCLIYRSIRSENCLFFVRPGKLVAFFTTFHKRAGKFLLEHVKIYFMYNLAVFVFGFCHAVGEQRGYLAHIPVNLVHRVHL